MGQTASLLAKDAPSLPHHSSIGSLSLPMTIFLEFWTSLTNYRSVTEKITISAHGKYPVGLIGRLWVRAGGSQQPVNRVDLWIDIRNNCLLAHCHQSEVLISKRNIKRIKTYIIVIINVIIISQIRKNMPLNKLFAIIIWRLWYNYLTLHKIKTLQLSGNREEGNISYYC